MTEADRLLYATLAGAAARHAGTGALTPEQEAAAVAELRELAGHRPDLLAHRAGTAIGFGESQYDAVVYRLIADLCIKAGADPAQIPAWIEVGRQRAELARQVPYTGAAHPASHPPPHPASHPPPHPAAPPASRPASHPASHPPPRPAAPPVSRPAPHPAAQPGAPRIRPGQVPG